MTVNPLARLFPKKSGLLPTVTTNTPLNYPVGIVERSPSTAYREGSPHHETTGRDSLVQPLERWAWICFVRRCNTFATYIDSCIHIDPAWIKYWLLTDLENQHVRYFNNQGIKSENPRDISSTMIWSTYTQDSVTKRRYCHTWYPHVHEQRRAQWETSSTNAGMRTKGFGYFYFFCKVCVCLFVCFTIIVVPSYKWITDPFYAQHVVCTVNQCHERKR